MIIVNTVIDKTNKIYDSLKDAFSGELSIFGGKASSTEQKIKEEKVVDPHHQVRLACKDGKAEVNVLSTAVMIASDANTAIGCVDGVCIIDGKVHMPRMPDELRIAGWWVINPETLTTIPSTIASPIETVIFKYPQYALNAAKIIKLVAL